MKIYELVIDNDSDTMLGVNAISLVTAPAIEADFQAFSKEEAKPKLFKQNFAATDNELRIVTGPALIPEKLIYRRREDEEFMVYLTAQTIRKASQLYLMRGRQAQVTIEHSERVDGVTLVESWIVESDSCDKSVAIGMPQQKGTWMVSMKIDNNEIWDDFIKTKELKGFSIEAFFSEIYKRDDTNLSKVEPSGEIDLIELLAELLELK